MLCDENFDCLNMYDTIIKANGFKIFNSHIHGITDKISQTGNDFIKEAKIFMAALKKVSHIVAHNAPFDVNTIKSELYRHNLLDIIEELDKKEILCTMRTTKHIVNIKVKTITGRTFLKMPKLAELYLAVVKQELQNAHNSKYDVINLHTIVKMLFDQGKLQLVNNPVLTKNRLLYMYNDCIKRMEITNKETQEITDKYLAILEGL
jgi:DNA polymerase III epsilon subunit-like protein